MIPKYVKIKFSHPDWFSQTTNINCKTPALLRFTYNETLTL